MSRWNAVSPILAAFLCGYHVPELAWAIDSGRGIHSATDLSLYLIVAVMGLWALIGAWRAFKAPGPVKTPN
jgi:hypothetical protein